MTVEKHFFEDMNWAKAHHAELLTQYEDQWVAIYDKHIVAHGSSIHDVEQQAQAKTGQKQIPVYFVESGSNIYAS